LQAATALGKGQRFILAGIGGLRFLCRGKTFFNGFRVKHGMTTGDIERRIMKYWGDFRYLLALAQVYD